MCLLAVGKPDVEWHFFPGMSFQVAVKTTRLSLHSPIRIKSRAWFFLNVSNVDVLNSLCVCLSSVLTRARQKYYAGVVGDLWLIFA